MNTEHKIDATNRTIGRIASEAASMIMGKNNATFARNVMPNVTVTITNASKIKIPLKKMTEKEYYRFSGYPGGRKSETLAEVITKKGYSEVFERAVYGMLPKNKLRQRMMKNLKVID